MKIKNMSWKMAFIAILALFLITGCMQITEITPDSATTNNPSSSEKGKLIMTITDAAANMGSVSEIHITVDEIQIYSKSEGWVTISNKQQTYDLLELKADNKAELLAEMELNADEYSQIRFDVEKVIVVDSSGKHTANIPSKEYTIQLKSKVEDKKTSTIALDIIADESLHVASNGEYVLAPVVEAESKSSAKVLIKSDNSVIVSGKTTQKTKVGMDINGNVGIGLSIPANVDLEISGVLNTIGISGSIKSDSNIDVKDTVINTSGRGKLFVGITDAAADMGSVSEIKITVDEVFVHSKTEGWISISTENKEYDLLELESNNRIELVAEIEIDSGDYDQIRLDISKIVVVDNEGEKEAQLPSGELKVMHKFGVDSNSNTAVTFDILADESLHTTSEDEYIFAPVILLESSEKATISIGRKDTLTIKSSQKSSVKVGMDLNGDIGVENIISSNLNLNVNAQGKIGII